jgi:hypothetical protein
MGQAVSQQQDFALKLASAIASLAETRINTLNIEVLSCPFFEKDRNRSRIHAGEYTEARDSIGLALVRIGDDP